MMKFAWLTIISTFFTTLALAQYQPGFKFSVGGELAIPSGTFSNSSSFGLGATGQIEVSLKDRLYGTGTSGILFYNGKAVPGTNFKQTGPTIIPARVGVKYFLTRALATGSTGYTGGSGGIYAGAQLGVAFISNNTNFNGTSFAYTPLIIGYEFRNRADRAFDAAIKYDAYSGTGTIGNFGLRLAYIF